jgi:FAD dependent oxidoreductase
MTSATPPPRAYDIIGFGDEVPGVLALVAASREHQRRTAKKPRALLMFKGNSPDGIGGHLVRGRLAYLDRSTIPADVRQSLKLSTFGDPASLYKEFLQRSSVVSIALDPAKADAALRAMLIDADVDFISRVELKAPLKKGAALTGIQTSKGEIYTAKQFIDATVNAELAQLAGVKKLRGFETFGLPESELPVTLVFETEGLSVQRLRGIELTYLQRFTDLSDAEAQRFLMTASGGNVAQADRFRASMRDSAGRLKTMQVGQDHIDVCCHGLSLAYHAFRGRAWSLKGSGAVLDQANIAILPNGRLSWNALLFFVTGTQAEALARGAAKPTPQMMDEFMQLERWLKSLGAIAVRPALELYIRHAGNVVDVVDSLSGADMLQGGVPAASALGTFGYYLDVRGGIDGLGSKAKNRGMTSINFHVAPLFNIGMHHALVKTVPNLAVVSPASGFDGYACAAGRIIEFNVAVGQAVGIAATIALLSNRHLSTVTNAEVRQVLAQTNQLPRIYGRPQVAEADRLAKFEVALGGTAIG